MFCFLFYTSHLSLEGRVLSKRAMCFTFKMKGRLGLAVLLTSQALFLRAIPSCSLRQDMLVFNQIAFSLALATHIVLDYLGTFTSTQTAVMTPGHVVFVFGIERLALPLHIRLPPAPTRYTYALCIEFPFGWLHCRIDGTEIESKVRIATAIWKSEMFGMIGAINT